MFNVKYDEFGNEIHYHMKSRDEDPEWWDYQTRLEKEYAEEYRKKYPEPTAMQKADDFFGFIIGCIGLYIVSSFIFHLFF